MHLEAVRLDRVGAVVIDRHRQEVILQVGPVEFGIAADETAGFELVAGADAGAQEQPFGADRRLVVQLQCRGQRDRLLALVLQVHFQMILQVGADAGQVVHQIDVQAAQQVGRADAGALQDLRRGDGAATQQHFAARGGALRLVVVQPLHAHGALAREQDAVGQRVGDDGQVRARLGQVQVATGGAGTTALRRDRTVHWAEAFLLVAVEVVGARITGLHTGLDHCCEQFVVAGLGRGDAQRAVTAVVVIGADVAGFGLAEIRQAVQVGPVFQARHAGPVVVVHRVAADVAHAVDQRRTAQALATTAIHPAVVHEGLGIGLVRPVVALALQREGQCGGHLGTEVEPVVRATGFQQQHADIGIFGEAGGQHVAGRTGADDDVVVLVMGAHGCSPAGRARCMQASRRNVGSARWPDDGRCSGRAGQNTLA
ncbi:hypothetical protein D3C72_1092230 [compost metagenome]